MNSRKWRNPYTPLTKKLARDTGGQAGVPLPSKSVVPAVDIRSSVTRMRNNIKGISSTIRQMEETMDTLYGAMEMLDSLGKTSSKTATAKSTPEQTNKRGLPENDLAEESAEASANPLGNLDLNQLINLLQSPLVQGLLSQTAASGKRKKEG
ncbi:hypothetical protein [Brevibacillus fulvus]|uniref:Uncharacterized protein n=1 Tax=Brevibacillus fulvus TaxID=1125967 RepID=A0A938XYC0_9BACL|nr:hypothetical protein [Brevibacillus fulvus]MBM7588696.1 hypothetical protein [Brevibacillus fulvus]